MMNPNFQGQETYKMVRVRTKGNQSFYTFKNYLWVNMRWQYIMMKMQIKYVILIFWHS